MAFAFMLCDVATYKRELMVLSDLKSAELCLKVTQYDASQHPSFIAPPGCLQWLTGNIGVVQNFNFKDVNSFHLSSQRYSICWRRERSYCALCLAVGYFGLSNVPSKAPSSSTTPWTKIAGMSDSICCSGKVSSNLPMQTCPGLLTPPPFLSSSRKKPKTPPKKVPKSSEFCRGELTESFPQWTLQHPTVVPRGPTTTSR